MDSTNIENELDQYGVWVKTPPHNAQDASPVPEAETNVSAPEDLFTDDFSLPPMDLDKGTVDEPETQEMNQVEEGASKSDLPVDFDMDISQFENADFGSDIEKIPETAVDSAPERVEEETVVQEKDDLPQVSSESLDLEDGEVDLDAFLSDSGDGEVSLDSFFGGSASDSNMQPDGDISLDAFLDVSDFGLGGSEKQENTVEQFDEPLDIDLTFEDTVIEEDESSGDDFDDFDAMFASASSSDSGTVDVSAFTSDSSEGIDLDNFDAMFDSIEDSGSSGSDNGGSAEKSFAGDVSSLGDSESIDLSEFDLSDEDSGNIKLGGDDVKPKAPVVQDYDLDIGEDFLDSDVGSESTEDNLELNMDTSSTGSDTLKQDDENPFSAPDSDFDVDSLFDSIVDETGSTPVAPKKERLETVEKDLGVDVPETEPALDLPVENEHENHGDHIQETVGNDVNDFVSDRESVTDEDKTNEIGETVESESTADTESTENMAETREDSMAETETAENEIDRPVFNDSDEVVQTEISMEPSEETKVEEDSVDLDNFMGEEGFSDPSICEGNRSYSPEELEEQERAKRQAESSETVVGEENNESFAEIDQTLVVDAAEGGTSNDLMDDDEVIPEPFYSPLVENEGNASEIFKESKADENEDKSSDEGFSLKGVDIVPADMDGLSYDENGGIAPAPVENSEETVAEIENQVDNSNIDTIPDNGEEKMDSTNTNSELSETKSLISQIAQELSLLRSEINELKTEFAEIKKGAVVEQKQQPASEEPEKEGGFFSDMDDDDTIALSGDELSNILSTAEFTPAEETPSDENILGSVVGAADVPEQEYENNLTMDFDNEKLEEPNLDSVQLVENSSEPDDSDMEIETPKLDDVLVAPEGTEYISADNASDEIVLEPAPEAVVEELVDEAPVGDPLESEEVVQESAEEETVQDAELERSAADETVEDEIEAEEPDAEETLVEEKSEPESVDESEPAEEEIFDEPVVETPVDSSESVGEPVIEENATETVENESVVEESVESETTQETGSESSESETADSEPSFEEPVVEESESEPVFDEPSSGDDFADEEPSEEITLPVPENQETQDIERGSETSEDAAEETFEEPKLDETEETVEENTEPETVEESVGTEESSGDEVVETEESDFEEPVATDELDRNVDNSISEENYDYLSEDADVEEDENIETGISEEPVNNVFDAWESKSEESVDETPAEESVGETVAEESADEETPAEESAEGTPAEDETADAALDESVDETPVSDEISAEDLDVAEEEEVLDAPYTGVVDDEVNEVPVEDDIVSEPAETVAASGVSSIPEEMKQEIKSVLAYMDQLLESLPEDKIAEFAQSEQFSTYKKLFTELGLS